MINCSFTFNLNLFSKSGLPTKGWGSTHIEIGSRFGWNFFTRIRRWNADTTELLPPVTKIRIRTVEYYEEVEEKMWDFMEKKYNYHWRFDDKAKSQPSNIDHLRLIQVIYRFPLITITNAYHTKLDEERYIETMKEIDKEIDSRG